jgi:hypothetical protein
MSTIKNRLHFIILLTPILLASLLWSQAKTILVVKDGVLYNSAELYAELGVTP